MDLDFRGIALGDFVKWNSEVGNNPMVNNATISENLHYENVWADEPLDCIMEVTAVTADDDTPSSVEIECVNCCGKHLIDVISEPEYENLAAQLCTGSPLKAIGAVEMSEMYKAVDFHPSPSKPKGYNFLEDFDHIVDLFNSQKLPYPYRRRA